MKDERPKKPKAAKALGKKRLASVWKAVDAGDESFLKQLNSPSMWG